MRFVLYFVLVFLSFCSGVDNEAMNEISSLPVRVIHRRVKKVKEEGLGKEERSNSSYQIRHKDLPACFD
jgi:hypothetical protein